MIGAGLIQGHQNFGEDKIGACLLPSANNKTYEKNPFTRILESTEHLSFENCKVHACKQTTL
jgi:hypothetical protein